MKLASIRRATVRGFTMIELMVSVAIMIMMTTLLLYNYPESAVRITLINSVHSISLLLREAQVRGSAIDSINSSLGGYGVKISIPPDMNADTQSQAILFGDTIEGTTVNSSGLAIGNGLFETTPIDETKSTTRLPKRYSITKICVGQTPSTCYTTADSYVIISFTRPSPLPSIYLNGSKVTNYSKACIELRSPRAPNVGHIRSVEIYNSGMIRTVITGCS